MTGPEAAARLGVTYRQLDYWCRIGLVSEQKAERHGSGRNRTFTRVEMTRLTHLTRLVHLGLDPRRAAEILDSATALIVDEHLVIDHDGIRLVLTAADVA